MLELKLKQNARTADLGFKTDQKCERCGCVSSAYIEIVTETQTYTICKGCLLEGVDTIDRGILEQTKKRV